MAVALIQPSEVRRVSDLAFLQLTTEELAKYSTELSAILTYITKLKEVNTSSVPPTYQATALANVFREDTVTSSLPQEEALKNALRVERGYFVVERVRAGV